MMLNLTSGGTESGALPIFDRHNRVVEKDRMVCRAAVVVRPEANMVKAWLVLVWRVGGFSWQWYTII